MCEGFGKLKNDPFAPKLCWNVQPRVVHVCVLEGERCDGRGKFENDDHLMARKTGLGVSKLEVHINGL